MDRQIASTDFQYRNRAALLAEMGKLTGGPIDIQFYKTRAQRMRRAAVRKVARSFMRRTVYGLNEFAAWFRPRWRSIDAAHPNTRVAAATIRRAAHHN